MAHVPPASLSYQYSIYCDATAARNAARIAAAFLADPGRERTHPGLAECFPDMGYSTIYKYLARFAGAEWASVREAPELRPFRGRNPVRAYALTPRGTACLAAYLRFHSRQIEDLDDALASAGTERDSHPSPGTAAADKTAGLLSPAAARVLLCLCAPAGRQPGQRPRTLGELTTAAGTATGLQPSWLGPTVATLTAEGWLRQAPGCGNERDCPVTLTSCGRASFPRAAALLRGQLAAMHQEVHDILRSGPAFPDMAIVREA